jgi:hypothetical protein
MSAAEIRRGYLYAADFDAPQKGVCQMHTYRILAALSALTLSSVALAQTAFLCGSVACPTDQNFTGIYDLVVGGDHFDVTFANTNQPPPFQFSEYASTPGQPLTGVDAANALNEFFASISIAQDPEILGPYGAYITAIGPTTGGLFGFDLTTPFIGEPYQPVSQAVGSIQAVTGIPSQPSSNTIWVPISAPVAAPEIDGSSAVTALTLLCGGALVLTGSRRART